MTNGLGELPYTFSVSGKFPTGLNLTANGVIEGTPTAAGVYPFTIDVTDNAGCQAFQTYSITVNCPGFSLTPPSLGAGVTNVPYSATITAVGNTTPVTFTLTGGSLPPGLFLSTSVTDFGVISGTPKTRTYPFQITVTDEDGCTVFMSYTILISCADLIITPPVSGSPGFVGVFLSNQHHQ